MVDFAVLCSGGQALLDEAIAFCACASNQNDSVFDAPKDNRVCLLLSSVMKPVDSGSTGAGCPPESELAFVVLLLVSTHAASSAV